jgi:hypothetical protein
VRHEALVPTLTVDSAAVSATEVVVDKYREKTVAIESSGTWTSTTVRLLGRVGDGEFVPVGYVSGSLAKTLTAAGCFLVPEAVDALKLEATAYNATSGTITARIAGFNSQAH